MGVQVAYLRDGLCVARCERVLVTFVRGELTLDYLAEAHRLGRELGMQYPERGIGSLTLLAAGVSIPEARVRQQADRNTREANAWVGAGATVVGGQGFGASVVRSLLTAMTSISGGPPRRVFGTPRGAVDWLAPLVGLPPAERSELVAWADRAMSGRL